MPCLGFALGCLVPIVFRMPHIQTVSQVIPNQCCAWSTQPFYCEACPGFHLRPGCLREVVSVEETLRKQRTADDEMASDMWQAVFEDPNCLALQNWERQFLPLCWYIEWRCHAGFWTSAFVSAGIGFRCQDVKCSPQYATILRGSAGCFFLETKHSEDFGA